MHLKMQRSRSKLCLAFVWPCVKYVVLHFVLCTLDQCWEYIFVMVQTVASLSTCTASHTTNSNVATHLPSFTTLFFMRMFSLGACGIQIWHRSCTHHGNQPAQPISSSGSMSFLLCGFPLGVRHGTIISIKGCHFGHCSKLLWHVSAIAKGRGACRSALEELIVGSICHTKTYAV